MFFAWFCSKLCPSKRRPESTKKLRTENRELRTGFYGTLEPHGGIPALTNPVVGAHVSRFHALPDRALLHCGRARDAIGRSRLAGFRDHPSRARLGPRRPRPVSPRRPALPGRRTRRRSSRPDAPAQHLLRRLHPLLGTAVVSHPAPLPLGLRNLRRT